MLFDVLLAIAAGIASVLVNLLPTFAWSVPALDLSWLMAPLASVNQFVPLDQFFLVLGLVITFRVALMVWSVLVFIYDRLPFFGHGAV